MKLSEGMGRVKKEAIHFVTDLYNRGTFLLQTWMDSSRTQISSYHSFMW